MVQDKSGLIRKVFIKGRSVEIFGEFPPTPASVRALYSFPAVPCWLIASLKHNWDVGQKFTAQWA
jgi:hypothetical protein